MLIYFVRRLALTIPTFFALMFLTFVAIRLVPGDPVEARVGERGISPERLAFFRHQLGLDLPVWRQGHGFGFHEFARRHGDFALAGAAALLDVGAGNVVRRAALSLCGVAATPVRVEAAEARLIGQPLDSTLIRSAAAAAWLVEPVSDIHAGAEYRRHLAQVLSARALTDAARRAGVDVPSVV